jgi:uncharacterized protein (TIGR02646 family)
MRKVTLGDPPNALTGADSLGGLERAKAISFYADPANGDKALPGDFKAYKDPAVKAAINAAFFFKCAYCESRYAGTQPVDVEHFRPKAGVNVNGRLKKPGYYWLAADWRNLLASCIFCNRENQQTFPDGSQRKSGKGNNFPIDKEAARASQPGDERKEGRLLLNPYLDNPDSHLSFDEEGIVRPARSRNGRQSRKGKVSIGIYGLLRSGLVQERARLAKDIATRIVLIENLMHVQEQTGNALLRTTISEEIAKLKGRLEPDQPYSTMARQLVEPFLERVTR